METVNFLAQLWGFAFIIIPLAILLRPKIIDIFFEIAGNEKTLIPIGAINMVLGIALVLLYNKWSLSWHIIVSIINWLFIARGILILFLPNQFKIIVQLLKKNINYIPYVSLTFIVLGCFLAFMGIY